LFELCNNRKIICPAKFLLPKFDFNDLKHLQKNIFKKHIIISLNYVIVDIPEIKPKPLL